MGSATASEWRQLTVRELEEVAPDRVALWAVGSTEQHGAHLATGFDHLVAEHIVSSVAAALPDSVLILPPLTIGASGHWVGLGGTLSVPARVVAEIIVEVCLSAAATGVRHVVVVNGHAGNIGPGLLALSELATRAAPVVEFVSYWELIDEPVLRRLLVSDTGIGHAGELETAIGLHLSALVRQDAIPAAAPAAVSGPGTPTPVHRAPDASRDTVAGIIGNPAVATAELGRAAVEHAIAALKAHCANVLGRGPAADGTSEAGV